MSVVISRRLVNIADKWWSELTFRTSLSIFSSHSGSFLSDADDFEPGQAKKDEPEKPTDKWDGEDEDDDVKDAWDKSDDEEKEGGDQPKAIQRKKKKKLEDILEEKAAKQRAELEAKAAKSAADKQQNTPEGRAAEKARLQKLDENSSLLLAKDMMGV